MKTTVLFPLAFVICAFFLFQGSTISSREPIVKIKADTVLVNYTGNVKTIIDNKCYGCHNSTSKSEKARHKLNLDSLSLITKVALISRFDKIMETLDKGEMPPKKYLERKPEAKLSAEETKTIRDWAQKNSDALLK